MLYCKIAIKNLAILQTCDLPAILRYRRIFVPHRIGDIRLVAKMASVPDRFSRGQLAGFPKNQSLFLGDSIAATVSFYDFYRKRESKDNKYPQYILIYRNHFFTRILCQ